MPLDFSSARISHYFVHDELGRDALGFTLRATDESLDRPVALRVLRAADVFPPEEVAAVRERFRHDAQQAARLSHPNLVTLYAFQRLGDMDLIAMELVEGETLEQRMAAGRRWSVIDAARMAARIADALAVAHAAGLVHGRLNPGNIVVRDDGRVKVLDLGIPKAVPDAYPVLEWGGASAPRSESAEARRPTPADDVSAVGAMIRRMVLGPDPDALAAADPTADHSLARLISERAGFGILQRAVEGAAAAGTAGGFADAGALRDALLEAVRTATERAPAAADARVPPPPGTAQPRLVVPPPRPPVAPVADSFDSDGGALEVLNRLPGEADAPRLALPADLSRGAHLPRSGSYIVLTNATMSNRIRNAMLPIADRIGSIGSGRLIAAGLVVAVLLAAGLVYQRRSTAEGLAVSPPEAADPVATSQGRPAPPAGEAPTVVAMTDTTNPDGAAGTPDTTPAAAQAPPPDFSLTAAVRGAPEGTRIAVLGDDSREWTDRADLTVAPGDSLMVEFSHPGYITQRRAFKGSRLAVSLVADSVVASFEANVPAEVFLFSPASSTTPRRIGSTNMAIRLPTGRYRILYRAPGQPDWTETHAMTTPGGRYTIAKNDYASQGDLVVTVSGAWGLVSVDGGTARETPYKFTGLSVGPHVVRISRDGFQTVIDTVVVGPAGTTTRQYTLRR